MTAVLGPTNTGKTHRAIERMLKHRSGMIGLPLRLLAREVYDRVCVERGPGEVALVTGEEKRIPPHPRYFVCTVEAMPLDRPVAFLAVDEIQLAADRTRGHVFTDRILHARGVLETLFLGSDTIAPLLRKLVPGLTIESQPRLSSLTWAGTSSLNGLPKRSAVVAFSVERVYALAERLRAKHGGVAVVLGALSPRTRNAQVDLFQSGEVPYLVATDAIGMGLNLDLDHVAFSDLGKFDGVGLRELSAAEIGQIAGRAGRYRRDGTFGALSELGDPDPEIVQAVQTHRFPPLETVWWRNHELDFASAEGLLASLSRRAPHPFLVRMRQAEDHETLEALAVRTEVAERATDPDRVALLWEVCQIPDFRKTLTDSHADLLSRLYQQLCDHGRLDSRWVARRIDHLDRVDGDLDALTTRIAFVRTWSYLSHRREWLEDAAGWQERTRDLEDRLSDALHAELTRRFVDRRAMRATRAWQAGEEMVDADGAVRVDGEEVAVVRGLTLHATPSLDRALRKAVRRAVRDEVARRAEALVAAPDDAFGVGPDGTLFWQGEAVGRWIHGSAPPEPVVRQLRHEVVPAPVREQIGHRLHRWTREQVAALLASLQDDPALTAPARALLHALRARGGSVPREEVTAEIRRLSGGDRTALARRSIRLGQRQVYGLETLEPDRVALRAALWTTWSGHRPAPEPPPPGATSVAVADGVPRAFYAAIGFPALGPLAVRVDIAERVAARVRKLVRKGPFEPPEELLSWLGCRHAELEGVLLALGLRRLDGDPPRFRAQSGRPGRRGRDRVPADWR